MEGESRAIVPDRYGFWRCDGKNKKNWMKPWGYWIDCPYKNICWRTKNIKTAWLVYSNICGEWNNYYWFYGDVLERK